MSQMPPPMPSPNPYSEAASKKLACGLCAILIGGLGIHKFILGYTTAGLIMLLVFASSPGRLQAQPQATSVTARWKAIMNSSLSPRLAST